MTLASRPGSPSLSAAPNAAGAALHGLDAPAASRLVSEEFEKLSSRIPAPVLATDRAAAHDAINSGVKALTPTLRTAAVSDAAGVLGKIGWDEAAKLLREANRPETPEDIRLLLEIKRELGGLRRDIRPSTAP